MEEVQRSYQDEHEAFAASRSSEYVYVPVDSSYFSHLNEHADTLEMDTKLPLVIVGEPGIGKNALLSNWVKQRASTRHRDEFLFQYFAGASAVASQLSHMLRSLESSLKEFFQLREMEVPASEERLIWSLNRFLAAAAKKHCPARIMVVIDGVFALKGEEMPAGALHWLPMELPPGVRFMVSTVPYELGGGDNMSHHPPRLHRTFLELQRRSCPMLRMEPMSQECQKAVIRAFPALELSDQQIQRILDLQARNKPMYLRTLLYALRLGVAMSTTGGGMGSAQAPPPSSPTSTPLDMLLNTYLAAPDSLTLTGTVLDMCARYVAPGEEGVAIMAAILSVLYASRDGLTDDEVWGAAEIVLGYELRPQQKTTMLMALRSNTMLVRGFRSFSHDEFRRAVYAKYIQSPETHVHLHTQMAKYFSRLPASDRRVNCLPYHLEVAGAWSKLKNSLVDIDMFDLWWTPAHKQRFISLWASLTRIDKGGSGGGGMGRGKVSPISANPPPPGARGSAWVVPPRPSYDIVEEYCCSLDEYKDRTHASDDRVGAVITKVSDFLLEFATLGHEEAADVPTFVHPHIPHEDLASLGVAYLDVDSKGHSVLYWPVLQETAGEDKPTSNLLEQDTKPNEDFPNCSTYFYRRWMWIQFPWVALANCGANYAKGIQVKKSSIDHAGSGAGKALTNSNLNSTLNKNVTRKPGLLTAGEGGDAPGGGQLVPQTSTVNLNGTMVPVSSSPMPVIPYRGPVKWKAPNKVKAKIAAKDSLRKGQAPGEEPKDPTKESPTGDDQDQNYWESLTHGIQDEIQAYRTELDIWVQRRILLDRKTKAMLEEETEMSLMANAKVSGEDRVEELKDKEGKILRNHARARQLARNYKCIIKMCQRHPAHSQAVIDELEIKLKQDTMLVREITARLREGRYEKMACNIDKAAMRKAAESAVDLQRAMLESRFRQHTLLEKAYLADEKRILAMSQGRPGSPWKNQHGSPNQSPGGNKTKSGTNTSGNNDSGPLGGIDGRNVVTPGGLGATGRTVSPAEEAWNKIRTMTGLSDPDMFIQKFLNVEQLTNQMRELKRAGEATLLERTQELAAQEKELHTLRFTPLVLGGSKDVRDLQRHLVQAQAKLRRLRESAEAAESLQRSSLSGLRHVCEKLGADASMVQEDPPNIPAMVRRVEYVLDSLLEEKDKATQKQGGNSNTGWNSMHTNTSGSNGVGDAQSSKSLDLSPGCPPEVELALSQFRSPKGRVAQRLPRRIAHAEETLNMSMPGGALSFLESEGNLGSSLGDDDTDEGKLLADRVAVKARAVKSYKAEQRRLAKLQRAQTSMAN